MIFSINRLVSSFTENITSYRFSLINNYNKKFSEYLAFSSLLSGVSPILCCYYVNNSYFIPARVTKKLHINHERKYIMKERIISIIVFLVVGFFAAEGSEAMIKSGGIKNVVFNAAKEKIDGNYNQYGNKGTLFVGDSGEKKIVSLTDPPVPLPPIPPIPG